MTSDIVRIMPICIRINLVPSYSDESEKWIQVKKQQQQQQNEFFFNCFYLYTSFK